MKTFFAIVLIVSTCAQVKNKRGHQFSLSIWDYNYSMAYTTLYKVNDDSVIVSNISGLEKEGNKILLSRKINEAEKEKLYNFLSTFPLDTISAEYKNPLIDDGDQKRVEIIFANKKKTIDLENVYQEDMERLFTIVNEVLEKKMQIKYREQK